MNEMIEIMQQKKISAAELSRLTGISRASISQYVNGKNQPSSASLNKIAEALGCKPEDIFPDTKVKETKLNSKVFNVPVMTAAKMMHKSNLFLYRGLQQGIFPFGYAVQSAPGKWSYYISSVKFEECTGIKVQEGN